MLRLRLPDVLLLLLLLSPLAGRAQQASSAFDDRDEIKVDAEEISYDRDAEQIIARRNVVIRRGDLTLRAEEVRLDQKSNQAEALGDVEITTPDGTVRADTARINLNDETGTLENASVRSEIRDYSLFGVHISKGIGQTYHVEQGYFTTCDCGDRAPDWSISGDEIDITLGGYGKLRAGTFNVLDVPVLYVPIAWFPVNLDRQSGFLRPRFGASNRRGFQAVLPFYWAINKSHDLTIAADVETSARVGGIAEYRYALDGVEGILSGSYFNELLGDSGGVDLDEEASDPNDPEGDKQRASIPNNRWSVASEHDQALPFGASGYIDGLVVSDDAFLRQINIFAFDYESDVKLRTLPYTETAAGALKTWQHAMVGIEAKYYQDLDAQWELEKETLQRAPRVMLSAQRSFGEYFLGELDSKLDDYQRESGPAGVRLDFRPGFVLPLPVGPYGFGSVRTSFRETAYGLTEDKLSSDDNEAMAGDPNSLDSTQTRETIEVAARVGTALTRVYDVQRWGLAKLQHTIEPAFEYLYVPSVSQDGKPFFDSIDRQNRRNLLTYGVASRFLGKFEDDGNGRDDVRELGRLWLAQGYDISRRIARVDDTEEETTADHFSDIDFGGRVNPSRDFSLRFRTQYDAKNNDLSGANVGVFIVDPREYGSGGELQELANRTSLGVSYRFLTANRLQEINSSLVLRLTDWVGFIYASRYDLVDNSFLDNHFGLRFVSTCDCWAFEIAVTDRTNPNEIEARAQLTLLGLGSLGGGTSDEGVAERLP